MAPAIGAVRAPCPHHTPSDRPSSLAGRGLIALDRNDRRVLVLAARAAETGARLTIPATAFPAMAAAAHDDRLAAQHLKSGITGRWEWTFGSRGRPPEPAGEPRRLHVEHGKGIDGMVVVAVPHSGLHVEPPIRYRYM